MRRQRDSRAVPARAGRDSISKYPYRLPRGIARLHAALDSLGASPHMGIGEPSIRLLRSLPASRSIRRIPAQPIELREPAVELGDHSTKNIPLLCRKILECDAERQDSLRTLGASAPTHLRGKRLRSLGQAVQFISTCVRGDEPHVPAFILS